MKRIMLISAAVLALAGCKAGDPQLGKASIDKVLKAMTLDEKVHFVIGTGMAGFGGESAVVGATKNIVPGAAGTTYPIERLVLHALPHRHPAGLDLEPGAGGERGQGHGRRGP